MRPLLAAALLLVLGCGRSGAIAEGDLAKLRPGCTFNDVVKAFGPGEPTMIDAVFYPCWESDDRYLFVFNGTILREVQRMRPDNTSVRVWPPP